MLSISFTYVQIVHSSPDFSFKNKCCVHLGTIGPYNLFFPYWPHVTFIGWCHRLPSKASSGRKGFSPKKQFAEFRGQMIQSIVLEDPDKIREVKDFEEFSGLFEFLFERS